jgi:hypothetical protein
VQVRYCNDNSIEFLAINRAHSRSYSPGTFQGLMIDLGALLNIEIQPDEKSAWFGGGTYDGQVMEYLWERGFVASKHPPAPRAFRGYLAKFHKQRGAATV